MSRCSAGGCECECSGNKGCGCWAMSDDPDTCDCHCYGSAFGGGLVAVNALVDVSISGLPLVDAAKFISSFHSEQVLVPTDLLSKLNKRVHLKVKRKRLSDVVSVWVSGGLSSFAACNMPTELRGYEQITTRSASAATSARMIGSWRCRGRPRKH